MYCPNCGAENEDRVAQCLYCGQDLRLHRQAGASPPTPPAPPITPNGPASAQKPYPPPQIPSYMVFSVLTTILCCLPLGVVAIVYSSKVNSRMAQGDFQGALDASKKAKIWCWISFASILLWAIVGVLAAIAIPQFMAYRVRAQDAVTRSALQHLVTAQEEYYGDYGAYADHIENLADRFVPPEDVEIVITYADSSKWSGRARHTVTGHEFEYDSDVGTRGP